MSLALIICNHIIWMLKQNLLKVFVQMFHVNVLGHIAENPIDEIFYENRGRTREVNTDEGNLQLSSLEPVKSIQSRFYMEQ